MLGKGNLAKQIDFTCKSEDCTSPGKCEGISITEVPSESIENCQRECQNYEGFDSDQDGEADTFCNYFTFDSLTQSCEFLTSCDHLEESCSDCTSGNVHCGFQPPPTNNSKPYINLKSKRMCRWISCILDYSKVMVIAGYDGYDEITSVELIDLSNDGKTCPDLPDYPLAVEYLTVAFFEFSVVACGGYYGYPSYLGTGQCFSLGPDLSEWKEFDTPLPYGRRFGEASSIIDDKWFISGGIDDDTDLSKSTLIYDGVQFSEGPDLLQRKVYHCQLTLNSTHVFFASGDSGLQTFLLDWEPETYTELDALSVSMISPSCGLLNNRNYGLEVLVATGRYSFIYSFKDMEWRNGPIIPDQRLYQMSALTNKGIMAIGGFYQKTLSSIYSFDENTYEWVTEKVELKFPRRNAGAIAVPDDFVNCI